MIEKSKIKYQFLVLILIFIIHIFFRFYQLEERASFSWDQVDNAWVAKNMIIDHKYPLVGMVAKQDSGLFIGPAYYYLAAFFYWIFDLDPIASPVLAGITSIFSFFALFYVAKRLFSERVALVALFIYSISIYTVLSDRVQWPVNFIMPISLLVFYCLYNIILGKAKFLPLLAVILGFSLHIHFTSILYFPIIFLSLPIIFYSKKLFKDKKFLRFFAFSIVLFFIWLIPSIVSELQSKGPQTRNISQFLQNSYHGVHLRRIIQIAKDAFIEYESFLIFPQLKFLKFLIPPVFAYFFYFTKPSKERFILVYLVALWFLVPWFAFSVYRGELTNYYFSLTRPIVIITLSYLLVRIFELKTIFPKLVVGSALLYFAYINIQQFFLIKSQGFPPLRKAAIQEVNLGIDHMFMYGAPEPYFNYYYMRKLKEKTDL